MMNSRPNRFVLLIVAAIAISLANGGVRQVLAATRTATLPSAPPISFSPPINSGPDTQRKSGSLLIGPSVSATTGSLCLNDDPLDDADDPLTCISSWDRFASIIGTSVAVTTGRFGLSSALSIASHVSQSGFIDLAGVAQSFCAGGTNPGTLCTGNPSICTANGGTCQPQTAVVRAPASNFCNLTDFTCYNDVTKTCSKNSDCGYNGTGVYALGNAYGSAGVFSGTLYIAPSLDPNIGSIRNNNLCLGYSQSPVCISGWNDFQYLAGITNKPAYIERFKTAQQPDAAAETLDLKSIAGTQGYYDASAGNGVFLSNHATMGTVDVGNVCTGNVRSDCPNPTSLTYTCGNGVCDNPSGISGNGELSSGTYKCEIDCSPPSIPTLLSLNTFTASTITLNLQPAAQNPTGAYRLLLVRATNSKLNNATGLCGGGTNNGLTCTLPGDCPGGTCTNNTNTWTSLFVPRNGVTYTAGQTYGTCINGSNPGVSCTNNATACQGGGSCVSVKIVYSAEVAATTSFTVTDNNGGTGLPAGATYYYALFQANAYPIYRLAPLFTNKAL